MNISKDETIKSLRSEITKLKSERATNFPDGVDWHIIGKDCDCMQEILPVADNAGEDINLYEELAEWRGKKCEDCGKYFKLIVEDGNMASKNNQTKENGI